MTRVFYDCEFIEDGRTIDLISIGMVRESDGAELYLVNRDMPVRRIRRHPWLMKNVVPSLPHGHGDRRLHMPKAWLFDYADPTVQRQAVIAAKVRRFIQDTPNAQLWAWYGAYDHVVLAQLFGPMIDLPNGVPMWTNDIQQEAHVSATRRCPSSPPASTTRSPTPATTSFAPASSTASPDPDSAKGRVVTSPGLTRPTMWPDGLCRPRSRAQTSRPHNRSIQRRSLTRDKAPTQPNPLSRKSRNSGQGRQRALLSHGSRALRHSGKTTGHGIAEMPPWGHGPVQATHHRRPVRAGQEPRQEPRTLTQLVDHPAHPKRRIRSWNMQAEDTGAAVINTDSYERLASLVSHIILTPEQEGDAEDGTVRFDSTLWSHLYEYAEGQTPHPDQIAEVTDFWGTHGSWSETNIAFLARLHDGRWASCVAWCDSSGFGCQQQVDWRINPTRKAAIAMGLDKESRTHLGLSLPDEVTKEQQ